MKTLRTWIEVDPKALVHNIKEFLRLIPQGTRLMAVVKSNAYGHGLVPIAKTLFALRSFSEGGWFGVDSVVEALRLRREGITNPILVLGLTLPSRIEEASSQNIIVTVSNFEALRSLVGVGQRPPLHIKIDTGMHRQGFLLSDVPRLLGLVKRFKIFPAGLYTHFSSAKDQAYPTYTNFQFDQFKKASQLFEKAGFKNLVCHAAASGGTILFPHTHLDMVRIGMGLYGYWPSPESKIVLPNTDRSVKNKKPKVILEPVLTWKTVVGEIKEIPRGSYVSYDLTERVSRQTKIAILPIGYWHGYDRGLSNIGEVLIRGKRRRVLGRVTMDMTIVDVTDGPGVKVGDEVIIIGRQKNESLWADELALKIGTSQYEFLTRINPLIKRFLVS